MQSSEARGVIRYIPITKIKVRSVVNAVDSFFLADLHNQLEICRKLRHQFAHTNWHLYPRAGGGAQSILTSSSCVGLGIGCGLDFLRRGFVCSALAVASFGLVVGPRSVLVLVGPRGGGFVCLNVGSRLVLVFFSVAFGACLRSALVRRGVCGGFVSPRCWLVAVHRVSH